MRSVRNPGQSEQPRIFLGVRRTASGGMAEVWARPDELWMETIARQRMIALAGMAGATGITGKRLGDLLDAYGFKFDVNAPVSRRGFLRATAAAAAAGTIACESSPTEPPGLDPDQTAEFVRAIITGPTEVQIPSPWGTVSALFDSKASTGGALKRYWKLTKDQDYFESPVQDLGDGRTAQADLTRVGDYTLELRVVRSGESSTATQKVTVSPPSSLSGDYPLIAFYRNLYEGTRLIGIALHLMDPSSGEDFPLLEGGPNWTYAQTLTWEKGGGRLATELGSNPPRIGVYNLFTDQFQEISRPEAQWSWIPSWNPQVDWIAYSERLRESYYEPVLVRPDGSESIYLAGDTPREEVSGHYSFWSPDGERLALANTRYSHYPPDLSFRISIYDDIWSGTPQRTQVPTEEQLLEFLDSVNDNDENNRITLWPGVNGMAMSPDGEWLVYTLYHGYLDIGGAHHYLAKSRVDGTGSIQILVDALSLPIVPRFSPNGREVLFAGYGPGEGRLYKMSIEGGRNSYTALTPGGNTMRDATPAWYQ